MFELNLNDLRRLGRMHNEHNATAKLKDGSIGILRPDGIYVNHLNVMIDGKQAAIQMRHLYPDIFSDIQTIKQGRALIAERRDGKLVATYKYGQSKTY